MNKKSQSILAFGGWIFMITFGLFNIQCTDLNSNDHSTMGKEGSLDLGLKGHNNFEDQIALDSRISGRITLDQLRRTIPRLLGEIAMPEFFNHYAQTLGEANYLDVLSHNLDPNPIFAKFFDEFALKQCMKAVQSDLSGINKSPYLIRHSDDKEKNLRWLILKFHGVHIPNDSTAGMEQYLNLYDSMVGEKNNPITRGNGWMLVCTALLTAPEFLAY